MYRNDQLPPFKIINNTQQSFEICHEDSEKKEVKAMQDKYNQRFPGRVAPTDKKNGKKLCDSEDGYTREFSLMKAVVIGILALIAASAIVISICNSAKNGKKLRAQKKELKRIKKLCKKSGVEYEEDLPF